MSAYRWIGWKREAAEYECTPSWRTKRRTNNHREIEQTYASVNFDGEKHLQQEPPRAGWFSRSKKESRACFRRAGRQAGAHSLFARLYKAYTFDSHRDVGTPLSSNDETTLEENLCLKLTALFSCSSHCGVLFTKSANRRCF